jgi:hypothetical protein
MKDLNQNKIDGTFIVVVVVVVVKLVHCTIFLRLEENPVWMPLYPLKIPGRLP